METKFFTAITVVTLSLTLSNTNAYSQDETSSPDTEKSSLVLETLYVTAQKRTENIQDVPISISAIYGDKIKNNAIPDLDSLASYIPNLSIDTSDDTNIRMRGLGSGDNEGFEQSVGMYIDGIYMARGRQYRNPLLDVERVEVLKGPQGIIFGQNTIAGAINIATTRPTDNFEAEVSLTLGTEFGDQDLIGIVSGPLSSNVNGRLVVQLAEDDGFLENTNALNRDDAPSEDEQTIRASLDWKINEKVNAFFKLESGSYEKNLKNTQVTTQGEINLSGLDTGFAPFTTTVDFSDYDSTFESNLDTQVHTGGLGIEFDDTDTSNLAFSLNHKLDNGLTITYVTGYTDYEYDNDVDVDFSPIPLLFRNRKQSYDQFSQEIRITSEQNNQFEYLAGFYFQDDELDSLAITDIQATALEPTSIVLPNLVLSAHNNFMQDGETLGLFAQGTWHLNEQLKLAAGIRITDVEKKASKAQVITEFQDDTPSPTLEANSFPILGFDTHDFTQSRSDSETTPSINLQYKHSDDTLMYVSLNTGFKAGGFNEDQESATEVNNPDFRDDFEYDSETSTSIEFGTKMTLADGAATLNVAIFNTEFEDLQTATLVGTNFVVENAAEATSQGIEVDGLWRITNQFTLGGSINYLNAEYDKFENGPCSSPATDTCSQNLAGKSLPFAPEYTANINFEYIKPITNNLELSIQGDANYSDDFFFETDLDPQDKQSSFTKYNARIAIRSLKDTWEVALIIKNLTDKITAVAGGDIPLLGDLNETINVPVPGILVAQTVSSPHYVWTAPGRNYLLNFTYRFQ